MGDEKRSSVWGGEETAETTFKFSICIKKKKLVWPTVYGIADFC